MKKWIGISAAVFLLILLGMSMFAGNKAAEEARFGMVQTEGEYISQIIQSDDRNFVLTKNVFEEKFQIVNTDKNLKEYQTVGTVHLDRVYQVFGFVQNQKKSWGIEPIALEKEEKWITPIIEAEGEFLAVGSTENEILISILGADQNSVTEYAISFGESEPVWTVHSSFSLIDGVHIQYADYDGNKLLFLQSDGKTFCKDVIVEQLEMAEGTVLASYFDKGILDGAKQTWIGCSVVYSVKDCIVPALIVTMIFVLFLYGSSRKEQIVYRMLCYHRYAYEYSRS